MIADIFYPIFTLTITRRNYKTKKQNCLGICIHTFTKASPCSPGGLKAPPDPQLQSFFALPSLVAPIFFLYYTLQVSEWIYSL